MPTYRVNDSVSGKTFDLTGDSPPTEQELEQIFSDMGNAPSEPTPAPAARPEGKVPAWAARYPNLYGIAGAARETLDPVIKAGAMIGGGVAGTAAAGPMGGLAGTGLGFAGAKNLLESADVALGNIPGSTLKEQVQELPGEINEEIGRASCRERV